MSSQFGVLFRVMTWGESHGGGVGVVIDGCPPRIAISEQDIQVELDRRPVRDLVRGIRGQNLGHADFNRCPESGCPSGSL
jgi:Chorismate synthase